ncbi:MAG TPA: hypothetical protein VEY06_02755 [Flavisolibacter sp.]|nr:hypothetical protein [Flavisolibacter sp.]
MDKKENTGLSSPTGGQGAVGKGAMRVEHLYVKRGWFTPPNATSLLIGTFPSVLIREQFGRIRSTDVDFFYGSADNNFWPDLSFIYNRTLLVTRTPEAVEQRKQLLIDLRLALSDCIYACQTNGSAMDTALGGLELNKALIQVLDDHPAIETLYFTSSSGPVNAETLTLRLLKEEGRLLKMQITQKSGPRMRMFLFRDGAGKLRTVKTVTLISPSPLAEQWGGVTPEKRRALYRKYLPALLK